MSAQLIEVICTRLDTRGDGKSSASPIRRLTQYWTPDGELLAEVDPCAEDITEQLRIERLKNMELEAVLAYYKQKARTWYEPDGRETLLDSEEEATMRRIEAARFIQKITTAAPVASFIPTTAAEPTPSTDH